MNKLDIVIKYREILLLYSGYEGTDKYQLTGTGKTCSDISLNIILDEGECKQAAKDLGRSYNGNDLSGSYPSGCYLFAHHTVFFNKHESGTGSAYAKAICKQGVYPFIHNQSLSKIYTKYLFMCILINISLRIYRYCWRIFLP